MMPFPWLSRMAGCPTSYTPTQQDTDSRLDPIEAVDDIDELVNESLERGRRDRK